MRPAELRMRNFGDLLCSGEIAAGADPRIVGTKRRFTVRRLRDTCAMDRDLSSVGSDSEQLLEGGEQVRVARYIALEREKQELRRERDHLVLDLAADLGHGELARRFGVEAVVIAKLLDGARGRLNEAPERGDRVSTEISARRLRTGEPRWVAADAHYEALGRASA
jgi:hypothetical protein